VTIFIDLDLNIKGVEDEKKVGTLQRTPPWDGTVPHSDRCSIINFRREALDLRDDVMFSSNLRRCSPLDKGWKGTQNTTSCLRICIGEFFGTLLLKAFGAFSSMAFVILARADDSAGLKCMAFARPVRRPVHPPDKVKDIWVPVRFRPLADHRT